MASDKETLDALRWCAQSKKALEKDNRQFHESALHVEMNSNIIAIHNTIMDALLGV